MTQPFPSLPSSVQFSHFPISLATIAASPANARRASSSSSYLVQRKCVTICSRKLN
ncbi:hypothetical protein Droror1_Dr00022767 [Drosera rotundifolia]